MPTSRTLPAVPPPSATLAPTPASGEHDLERLVARRHEFRLRHARALSGLMGQRADLRGVHALADLVDDAVRWTV